MTVRSSVRWLACPVVMIGLLGVVQAQGTIDAPALRSEAPATLAARCDLAKYGIEDPAMREPVVRVEDFGARGDGVTDDSDAIGAAIASLRGGGGTVVFARGARYLKRKLVQVDRPNVTLWGYGATLLAVSNADEQKGPKGSVRNAVQLVAPRTSIVGFTIVSNLRRRLTGHPTLNAIWLSGPDQSAIDNRIEYSQGGIFVRMATGFTVARNVVWRTTADAIHMTTGMRDGLVVCNTVRENGDDMIAVVNYGKGAPTIGNVRIEDNDLAGQYWGRGITVSGGRDITIRGNRIRDITHAAAILIVSEDSYQTADVENVLIEGNLIERVQTTRPTWNPIDATQRTPHGAIDIGGYGAQKVRRVLVRDNTIRDAARAALVFRGNACDVQFQGNHLARVGATIRYEGALLPDCATACSGNDVDGRATGNPRCAAGVDVDAAGAAPR